MGNSLSAADPLRLLKQPTPFLRQYGVGGMYSGADGAAPSGCHSSHIGSQTYILLFLFMFLHRNLNY